ncbi:hypothetical protein [Sorangium sp. So ce128]|uniref:hypothetical protein n=1 Tax=Sorangium sp. So ce128 TaxID=3133281 RepID=UPI003F609317
MTRTISMAAALLALGAGAALVGVSCIRPCSGQECWTDMQRTCPGTWQCSHDLRPRSEYVKEHFDTRGVVLVWIGDPRDAPDCRSANAYPGWDYYMDPKPIDRCPRCVAEPLRERSYTRLTMMKGGHCADGTDVDASPAGGFVLPVAWDGSCLSERVIRHRSAEDADLVWGGYTYEIPEPNCKVSLAPEDVAASWGTIVRTCWRVWELDEVCASFGAMCVPYQAPGFRECLGYIGDEETPTCPDELPVFVRAYAGVAGCTTCYVEETGSRETTETLTFYADEQCTRPIPAVGVADDVCFDLPPGSAPRSISATFTVERTATCTAVGGEQEGDLGPGRVVRFCCEPPA